LRLAGRNDGHDKGKSKNWVDVKRGGRERSSLTGYLLFIGKCFSCVCRGQHIDLLAKPPLKRSYCLNFPLNLFRRFFPKDINFDNITYNEIAKA
jgi:hypothetical protein